jgi:putative transposase
MPDVRLIRTLAHCSRTVLRVMADLVRLALLAARSRRALAAENLFLRKQLALFQERQVKPLRANDATRWTMAMLSRMFAWRGALVNVKPDTLIGWHRKGFRLFWRWKSKPTGRPRLSKDLRELIRQMAAEKRDLGARNVSPTSCNSSWVFGCRHARSASICEWAGRNGRLTRSSAG